MSEPQASKLVGVGVGPGDPELVTVRAVRILREADRVLAPSSAVDAVGRAESIVRQACPDVRVERVAIEMGRSDDSMDEAAAIVVAGLDAGQRLAFVTLGDPNVYSTFSTLAARVRHLRPDARIDTVPGIMAFQELASRSGTVVVQNAERLALITALDGPRALEGALADPTQAVIVYKGGRHLPALAKRLAEAGRLDGAVVGELLGLPGERIVDVATAGETPAAYLATLIVPPAPASDGGLSGASAESGLRGGGTLERARKGEVDRPGGEQSELPPVGREGQPAEGGPSSVSTAGGL